MRRGRRTWVRAIAIIGGFAIGTTGIVMAGARTIGLTATTRAATTLRDRPSVLASARGSTTATGGNIKQMKKAADAAFFVRGGKCNPCSVAPTATKER